MTKKNVIDNNRKKIVLIEKKIRLVKVILRKSLTLLKKTKNNRKTTKRISVKSHGNNINLHPRIIKLLNAEKTMLKK